MIVLNAACERRGGLATKRRPARWPMRSRTEPRPPRPVARTVRMESSPYFSTWGPTAGPIRMSDAPPALGVVEDPDLPPMPIGTAYPVGYLPDDGGPVVT